MSKHWTQEEVEYLETAWGNATIPYIAKKLNRSVAGIKNKAYRLGFIRHIHSGEYATINCFMKSIRLTSGYSYTLGQWMEKGLPVKYKKSLNMKYKIIYLQDFWDWAEKNRTLIDFAKMEKNILGAEPGWVKEQRKADELKKVLFKTTPWTKCEDRELKYLLSQFKYTYNEIAVKLTRTEGAIAKRMSDLNIKMRPVKAYNHNRWTEKEVEKLIELYNLGYDRNVIATFLEGRGAKAIEGKIERLIKSGEIKSIKHKKCV